MKKVPPAVFGFCGVVFALVAIASLRYSIVYNDLDMMIGVIVFLPLALVSLGVCQWQLNRNTNEILKNQMMQFAAANEFEFVDSAEGLMIGEAHELEPFRWDSPSVSDVMTKQTKAGPITMFLVTIISAPGFEGDTSRSRFAMALIGRLHPNGFPVRVSPRKGLGIEMALLSVEFFIRKVMNLLSGKKRRRRPAMTPPTDESKPEASSYRTRHRDLAEESYEIEEAPGVTLDDEVLIFLSENPGWEIQATKNMTLVWKRLSPWSNVIQGLKTPFKLVISPSPEFLAELLQFSVDAADALTQKK